MPPKVRIADFADGDGTVCERTFEDCEIIGPVALVPVGTGNEVLECEYPGTPEYLAQARGGPSTDDIVFVADCTFRRGRFALDVDATHLHPTDGG
jgi:hypothetical protein